MPDDQRTPSAVRPLHWAILALIVILACVLRCRGIGRQSLTLDEMDSIEVASGWGFVDRDIPRGVILHPPPMIVGLNDARPIWKIPGAMTLDVHPPLYFVLLRIWQDIFGDGDAASRAFSAAAGVGCVLLIFELGRSLRSTNVGLCAALLMAVAQPQIAYAQDARPYTLSEFFMLGAAVMLIRIERLGARPWRITALGSFLAAVCLTHYFALPAIATFAVYTILPGRRRLLRSVWPAFIAAGVFVLLVWGRGMWIQRSNFTDPWMFWFGDDAAQPHLATLARMAQLPVRYLIEPPAAAAGAASLAAVCYVLPWLRLRREPGILLPGILLLACAAFITALDFFRGTHQVIWIKYSLLGAPGLYLIIPMLLERIWLRLLLVTAMAACCIPFALNVDKENANSLRQIAVKLDQVRGDNDVVILMAPEPGMLGRWITGSYYMALERYCRRIPPEVVLMQSPASSELLQKLAGRNCWLIGPMGGGDAERFMPGWEAESKILFPPNAALYKWSSESVQ